MTIIQQPTLFEIEILEQLEIKEQYDVRMLRFFPY